MQFSTLFIIRSRHVNLIRIILTNEALVDELIPGGELVDNLVQPPDRIVLRDLFFTGSRSKMLGCDET